MPPPAGTNFEAAMSSASARAEGEAGASRSRGAEAFRDAGDAPRSPETYDAGRATRACAGTPLNSVMSSAIRIPLLASNSARSEEHTSELQSLMRISYAVFCLKKKKQK